jgi:putative transposase
LRSLKQTVRLNHLSVQSVDMMEKELLAAMLAYNLVRAVMCLAARKAGIDSRQLSFTYACNLVQGGIAGVLAGPTHAVQIERMERLVDLVARCKLPNRTKRRSYPREVWGRGRAFPSRHEKTK